jgi:hypothetical protein
MLQLPRHGDRSKLLTHLIEQYLLGRIDVTGVSLRSLSIAHRNTWQQP